MATQQNEQFQEIIELYNTLYIFPREVGDPERRIVNNVSDFIRFILDCTRSNKPAFTAVYAFRDKEFKDPIIDRIFLDFDASEGDLEDCWDEVREFAKFLKLAKINPLVVFSGKKGFHIYIFFPEVKLKHPKESIQKFVALLITRFESEKKVKVRYLDRKVVGDIRRLARIPYSVHEDTKRFAIIVRDLDQTLDDILEESVNPKFIAVPIIRSQEAFIVLKYIDEVTDVEQTKFKTEEERKEGIIYLQLPCIRKLLSTVLPPGKRRMGAAKFLAIAYYLDHNGSMDGFETIADLFAERQQIGHQLKKAEVIGWKRGVYQLNDGRGPVWNCAEIRDYFKEAFLPIQCHRCPLERIRVEEEIRKKLTEIKTLRALENKDLLEDIKRVLDWYIVGEEENKLLVFLLLLENQNVIIRGPPSSGKSTLVEAVLKLFPDEDVLVVSGATKKFLRWMDKDYIPILYLKEAPKDLLEEIKGEGLAMDIKLAMSDKELKILAVDPQLKRTVERKIKVDSIVMTTIDIDLPADIESRAWILSPDISSEQTKKVLLFKAMKYSPNEPQPDERIVEKIKTYSKALRSSTKVIIPGSEYIAEAFFEYSRYPRVRRDIEKLYLLIGAIAKVRGRIYEINGDRCVIASPEDVKTALDLSRNVITAMISNIDTFIYSIYKAFKELTDKTPTLTPEIISDFLDIPQSLAEEYLEKLVKSGLAVKYKEGTQTVYRLREMNERVINIDFDKLQKAYDQFMSDLKQKLQNSNQTTEEKK
jgi:predicted transcriptional regulator/energy-coupling factor transporter ATP-binding protein EcfA2